jgi:Rha family phage regulatory protein|nr:MAG TPA: KilAC domain protein [Caudoviricetes sp.]
MSDIVLSMQSGEPVASSRQIADNFEKRHDHVMRDIDAMKKDVPNFGEMFFETTAPDSYGREQRTYLMNRDGFTLLAMGFTGKAALEWKLKYIAAFNEMEKKLADQPQLTRSQLLATALIAAHEELEEKDKQIETMKPKVLFADAVSASKKSILVGELAKLLSQNGINIGQNRLFDWMRKNGYLIKDPKRSDYNLPTQRSMEKGLFEIKETTIQHSDHVSINRTPKVTGKGQVYFVNLFLKSEKQEPTAPSGFELEVKMKLLQRGMKQTELIQAVQSDTGLFLDDSYLYKILRGERKPEKIIQSICKILEIEQKED